MHWHAQDLTRLASTAWIACSTLESVFLLQLFITSTSLELTHQEELSSKTRGRIEKLTFSSDGQHLAWATPARIITIDLSRSRRSFSLHRLQRRKASEPAGSDDAAEDEDVQRIRSLKRAPWSNAVGE